MLTKTGAAKKAVYYGNNNVQPIDLIASQGLNFIEGNIVKYVCRYKLKGTPVEDLEKAQQYVTWLLELAKEEQEKNSGWRKYRKTKNRRSSYKRKSTRKNRVASLMKVNGKSQTKEKA